MNETKTVFDVVIVGGAAAGMTAAIFAARRGLKTAVVTKNIGGQMASTVDIENYPGFDYIEGSDLSKKMADQAEKNGAEIIYDQVTGITKSSDPAMFTVATEREALTARAVIITLGKTPRSLDVPGEKELLGKGVSYAAGVELEKYKGQPVVIVGGGGSAFEALKSAVKLGCPVTLINRTDQFKAEKTVMDKLAGQPNVTIKTFSNVTEIHGQEKVESVTVTNSESNATEEIDCAAVFIEIGHEIKRDLFADLVKTDEHNRIIVNDRQESSCPGLFAAGDITNQPYNQIVISAGEGATAALSAFGYLSGQTVVGTDWGKN